MILRMPENTQFQTWTHAHLQQLCTYEQEGVHWFHQEMIASRQSTHCAIPRGPLRPSQRRIPNDKNPLPCISSSFFFLR